MPPGQSFLNAGVSLNEPIKGGHISLPETSPSWRRDPRLLAALSSDRIRAVASFNCGAMSRVMMAAKANDR